jgi:hypothetical protein
MPAESEQQVRLELLLVSCNRSPQIRVRIPISCCWRTPAVFEEQGRHYDIVIAVTDKKDFPYSNDFKLFLETSRAILSEAALASKYSLKMLFEGLGRKVLPGAVGAVLSASNRFGKGEAEESYVADGVIMEIIRLVVDYDDSESRKTS